VVYFISWHLARVVLTYSSMRFSYWTHLWLYGTVKG